MLIKVLKVVALVLRFSAGELRFVAFLREAPLEKFLPLVAEIGNPSQKGP